MKSREENEGVSLSETFYEEEESPDRDFFELLKLLIEKETDVKKMKDLLVDVISSQKEKIIDAREANILKTMISKKIDKKNKAIFYQIKDWIDEKEKSFDEYLKEENPNATKEADFWITIDEIVDLIELIKDDYYTDDEFLEIIPLEINKKTKRPVKKEKEKLISDLKDLNKKIEKKLGGYGIE